MDYRITAEDRARFKRCRRQWDFASPHRRDLEPVSPDVRALPSALTEALAVYYYPGTWDWPHQLTQSIVHKALERSLEGADALNQAARGAALLDCYDAWAQSVDDFAPVKINHDALALVPDPDEPERGLTTPDGAAVKYGCEIDLVVADRGDEYWVVCHRIVEDWLDTAALIGDDAALAACWAWEHDFIGVTIAGTMHNELRLSGPLKFPAARAARTVAQHEPSGGGRSIPQHERVLSKAARGEPENRVQQQVAGVLRRTRIRRTRAEVAAVPHQIAAEVAVMTGQPVIDPNFAGHCAECEFAAPCLTMLAAGDPDTLLASGFRRHVAGPPKARLGQSTWGFGRGAAPPQW